MKTRYIFICFKEMEAQKNKTYRAYECRNNKSNDVLGWISFYAPWRQNVFTAAKNWPIFNNSCLTDIQHFMEQLEKPKDDRAE